MKEHVQMISWSVEFASLVVAVLVAGFVWRVSARASRHRKDRDRH